MKTKFIFSILLLSLILLILFLAGCGIPQVLPVLVIPIAEKTSLTIDNLIEFDTEVINFNCENKETYFKGYYFFYRDKDLYLKQGKFRYFDENNNKSIVVDAIPTSDELEDFKLLSDSFTFKFCFSESSYSSSIIDGIKDTYILMQENGEDYLSNLYNDKKTITIYLIPVGEDLNGQYIYTPALSTTQNRVIIYF